MISLILQPYLSTQNHYLSQTSYLQCKSFITIVVQHTLAYKVTSEFQSLIHKPDLDYIIYTLAGHFSSKLYPIQDQNCLISLPYPRLNCL